MDKKYGVYICTGCGIGDALDIDGLCATVKKARKTAKTHPFLCGQDGVAMLKKDISEESASEDVRKIAHVTCGLALNQSRTEKQKGIMRISQLVAREERNTYMQAVVLQCLDIARPCIDSKLLQQVEFAEEHPESEENNNYKRKKETR